MKFNSNSTQTSITHDCIYSAAYKGWDDVVGHALYQMSERAISNAGHNLNSILSNMDECDCDFEKDLLWLEEKLKEYR